MVYYNRGGCLSLIVLSFIIFMILSFFTRFLFTTPGLILIGVVLIYYFFFKGNDKLDDQASKEEVIFEETNHTSTEEDEFSRDAEDVDYKNID